MTRAKSRNWEGGSTAIAMTGEDVQRRIGGAIVFNRGGVTLCRVPAQYVTTDNLRIQTGCSDGWPQNANKVGCLGGIHHHAGIVGRIVEFVERSQFGERNTRALVISGVLDQIVGIRLTPVTAAATGSRSATEGASVGFITVGLHVSGSAP